MNMKHCTGGRLMRALIAAVAATAAASSLSAQTRAVTDMAGRRVVVPVAARRVVSLSNNATVYLFTLAPDRLLGWSFAPKAEARKFIGDAYFALPNLGTAAMKSNNYEEILKLGPDLIVCSDEDETYDPDALQAKLKVPIVKVATELSLTDKVYLFLGECLGEPARAKALADYSRAALDEAAAIAASVPAGRRARVYYAEGSGGLQTDVAGNVHAEVLEMAGGKNVADVAEGRVGSMVQVSMEQVLAWDPETIIVGIGRQGDFLSTVYGDPRWAGIKAVKARRVFRMPSLPFNWFDRPPSPARILALRWVGKLLYPDAFTRDLVRDTREFYSLFYRYDLSDAEAAVLLKDAM